MSHVRGIALTVRTETAISMASGGGANEPAGGRHGLPVSQTPTLSHHREAEPGQISTILGGMGLSAIPRLTPLYEA